MKHKHEAEFGDRERYSIHIGGIRATDQPSVIRTVLGSCISVCLRDPALQVGGMNHFMLPETSSGDAVSARYGVHAMELLINECMKHGADRRRLEAKVFGGGHVLKMRESDDNVPQKNIRFALQFLETENIPIVARDLGGYQPREVIFFTDSGRTLLKRMTRTGPSEEETLRAERSHLKPVAAAPPADDSNITLF